MQMRLLTQLPLACALAGVLGGKPAGAQSVLGGRAGDGTIRLVQSDLALLELREPRKDLPCTVTPIKPSLGFDLRLHAGYEVTLPLKDLTPSGTHSALNILFRVTPENRKENPVYLGQRIPVPPIREDAQGVAEFEGVFDVGEGNYHVDWLMRDQAERACSGYWDVEAARSASEKDVELDLPPGEVQATEREPFLEDPPVERVQGERPLNVKVLVNFAPQKANSAVLRPLDVSALVSILRSLNRESRIGAFSVVAFNLHEQRIIFRQQAAPRIDFPALGRAVDSLNLATVDIRQLGEKHADTRFLSELVRDEAVSVGGFDALVFAGPKTLLDENVPSEDLGKVGPIGYPLFYLNYILDPQAVPWRDAIGNVVRFFKGDEYTISRPKDLWNAMGELVSRIVALKSGSQTVSSAGR
jgi:hypothetical protein